MQLTYKYRLKPTKAQLTTIAAHLELCRRQYNYRLGERFRWWESTRTPINACPLTASIVPIEEIYQSIPLTRTQIDNLDIIKDEQGRICIDLAKIGQVPMVFHRPIPPNFKVKTGTVIREADGWYISLTLEDKTVPVTVAEIQPTSENSLGIDLGINNYVYLSNGERVENPRFLRKWAEKLARIQAKLAKRVKGSKPWQIIKGKISKLHQFVARTRFDFQFKTAHFLFGKCDVLVVEDLSIKNLTRRAKVKTDIDDGNLVYLPNGQSAKSGLNKSMLDAAHGQFATVIKYVAWKLGKSVLFVDPKGTSQHCWNCLNKVPKELSDRWHSCQCGESLDRDENSAKLIKRIGLSYESGGGSTSLKKAFAQKEKEACGLTVLS